MAKRTKYFSASSFSGKDRGDNRGQSPGRRGPDAAKRAPVETGNVDTSTLTQDEIDEIRQAFDLFDSDQSGTIDPREVQAALASLGGSGSPTIFRLLAGIETLGAEIDFEAFLGHITVQLGNRNSRSGIQKIFELFDDDGTETIHVGNMKRVAKELGEGMTEDELQEALARTSSNQKELTPDDFYVVMTKKVYK